MSVEQYKKIGKIEDRLIEECGELIQAICKARRFGYSSYDPDNPRTNNTIDILSEIDDVERTCSEMKEFIQKEK